MKSATLPSRRLVSAGKNADQPFVLSVTFAAFSTPVALQESTAEVRPGSLTVCNVRHVIGLGLIGIGGACRGS